MRGVGVDLEAALAQPLDLVHVGGEVEAADRADPVDPGRERPFGGERRVELADRAGGRVARVGEGRFLGFGAALVERFEGGDRQVDLAAHFDQLRRVLDPQRDRADRAQVLGDVLADPAVAAGGAADQHAVLVGERDRQAVDLRLGRVAELRGADVEALQVVGEPRSPRRAAPPRCGRCRARASARGARPARSAPAAARRPAGSASRACAAPGSRPRSRAARRAARRRRRRRSPVRRGRSRGGCGAPSCSRSSAARCAAGVAHAGRRARRQHLLEAPAAQPLQAAVVGEVEVDRGDRDPALRDRVEVGSLDLLVAGLPAVDLVAAAAASVLADQLQLVVVDPFAELGHLDPGRLAGGAVDVDQRCLRHRLGEQRADQLRREGGGDGEVEAAADVAHAAARGLLGDGDRGDAEDDPLQGRGDGPRVGDVVAEVGAVVDPGDDQVGAVADQAELGEADAVDRGAVGRVAAVAVVELDLLDAERRAGRDAAGGGAAVGVGGDHVELDAVDLAQRPPQRPAGRGRRCRRRW